jgi:glycosyltransferase
VLIQSCQEVEYIIIDGGSTDATLEIINKYKDKIFKIISEPDKGIYDAMNKGIKMATGDIVGILNSDDFYNNPNVLDNVINEFKRSDVDVVYGDIVYVDRENTQKQVRRWQAGSYKQKNLKDGWIMPHPAFFVKKEVYDKFGLFNLNFRIAADYELMLRFLKNGLSVSYLPEVLVCMREGGYSASGLKKRFSGWVELKQAWRINNLKLPLFFITRRILSKVKQYFV